MKTVSKNVYFDDVLNDLVTNFKMKPIDVQSDSYAKNNVYSNKKGPKFKIGDHDRIFQNLKTFFLKDLILIGQKKFFVIEKIKNTVPWLLVFYW